jgi:hypothetical protein
MKDYNILVACFFMLFGLGLAQDDCENPLLREEFNPYAPTAGVLTEPKVVDLFQTVNICRYLQKKKQCCDGAAWHQLNWQYYQMKKRFVDIRKTKA